MKPKSFYKKIVSFYILWTELCFSKFTKKCAVAILNIVVSDPILIDIRSASNCVIILFGGYDTSTSLPVMLVGRPSGTTIRILLNTFMIEHLVSCGRCFGCKCLRTQGSKVQKVQGFKGSRVQGSKGPRVQGPKDPRFKESKGQRTQESKTG